MTLQKKLTKVLIISIAALAVIVGVVLGVVYINVTSIRFDYSNSKKHSFDIPFFANSMLSDQANVYTPILGWGEDTIDVYQAVNTPLNAWASTISRDHKDDRIDIKYNVENDGRTLKVSFSGTAGDSSVEKDFVFDIQNASVKNLPRWTNPTEEERAFYS